MNSNDDILIGAKNFFGSGWLLVGSQKIGNVEISNAKPALSVNINNLKVLARPSTWNAGYSICERVPSSSTGPTTPSPFGNLPVYF